MNYNGNGPAVEHGLDDRRGSQDPCLQVGSEERLCISRMTVAIRAKKSRGRVKVLVQQGPMRESLRLVEEADGYCESDELSRLCPPRPVYPGSKKQFHR